MKKYVTANGDVVYRELSYKIMSAVFEVHNGLGPGFLESIYEEALVHELGLRGLHVERQREMPVYYKEKLVGQHRLDVVVEDKIILELKAVAALNDAHKQQTLSYLKATGFKLGILINFGTPKAQSVRIAN
jgi:GxxExxY protein